MLSILIQKPEDLTLSNIFIGYFNAFGELGYKVNWLNKEPSFDRFYETRPDIFITETGLLNKAVVKACIKHKPIVALYLAKDAHVTQDSLANVKFMLESGIDIRPFAIKVDIWSTGKLNPWHEWVKECNLLPKIIEPAADTIRFKQGKYREEFACDRCYIGTWHPNKKHIIDFLDYSYRYGHSVRVYGYGNWNHPFHVGAISDKDYMDVLASSKVNIINHIGNNDEKWYRIKLANLTHAGIDKDGSAYQGFSLMGDNEYKLFLETESYIARAKDILKCVNLG